MAHSLTRWFDKSRLLVALIVAAALASCAQHTAEGAHVAPSAAEPPQPVLKRKGNNNDMDGFASPQEAPPSHSEEAAPTGPAAEAPSEDRASASGSRTRAGAGVIAPRAPRSRPGLGTVWGEDRASRIRHTSFQRAESARPFATTTLFYNDHAGIQAMARESALSNHGDGGFSVQNGAVTVRLLGAGGQALPAFEVASRDYVVGEHGERYRIQVQNHTDERIEVVATVDGLDVVDGEVGSFSKRGYVMSPFGTLEIEGYRRSEDTVAAFRFGSVRDSYAAKKAKARNVGVIGVAFFHERGSSLPWTRGEVRLRHTADPFPVRFATPPSH